MAGAGRGLHEMHVPSAKLFWVLWTIVTVWLIACAFLVNGEYLFKDIANFTFIDKLSITASGPVAFETLQISKYKEE